MARSRRNFLGMAAGIAGAGALGLAPMAKGAAPPTPNPSLTDGVFFPAKSPEFLAAMEAAKERGARPRELGVQFVVAETVRHWNPAFHDTFVAFLDALDALTPHSLTVPVTVGIYVAESQDRRGLRYTRVWDTFATDDEHARDFAYIQAEVNRLIRVHFGADGFARVHSLTDGVEFDSPTTLSGSTGVITHDVAAWIT